MPALLHSPNARPNARTAAGTPRENPSGWSRLLGLAACRGARFRFRPAASEGVARCVVLRVKRGKRTLRHVLAVVPEGCALDLIAVARLYGAGSAGFVTPETAASVTGFSGPLRRTRPTRRWS
ncbi:MULTISPECIES: hypothetical protein [unclassified Streptomyces]|uniref:hypothetical protein n=1 Tax=unclassified Streptomyces TaxID=2593676 RepID=UPI0022B68D1F|nr:MULTISPECIES: hypothetical protein [unclassified Streptomyces]MCZ7414656.1 hypothetical protein [Streptomyces sp. WMMC897]MCZ7431585.1 hypothetical protein [Streptomyces sp. WMMC1477]